MILQVLGNIANEDLDGDSQLFTFSLRYPGQYYDEETGLHYNYFRDYDPSTGRYIESDPIGLGGGLNTYAYVSGNPLKNSDPYGLFTWGLSGGFGASYKGKAVGGSITISFDHNGEFIIVATPEAGVGTKGVNIFGRGVIGLGDNTVDNLIGPGASISGTGKILSGSLTLPYVYTPETENCDPNGDGIYGTHGFNDPIAEFGVGRGKGVSATVGVGHEVYRTSVLGDIGRWIGGNVYDLLH